jgi:ATP-dependent DNA helicase RecG
MLTANKKIAPVRRIVIGDVGSGKTIVAFIIALVYLKNLDSAQSALLAPTEVLAFQHYQSLLKLKQSFEAEDDWLECFFISNKKFFHNDLEIKKSEFKKLLPKILETKKKLFFIGTQAVFFLPDIKPNLILIDEQHRFGVNQRNFLFKQNSDFDSHFISFSATPIPRSLAMTVYGYLKPHFLEKLSDRHKVETKIKGFNDLENEVYNLILERIKLQQKVFLIVPSIEENEENPDLLWSIEKAQKWLENKFQNQFLVVHGRQAEKKDLLNNFKDDQTKPILLATTVVEVGVDVTEATMMIVLNAERFGLATLHQLRGRVGRNNYTNNICFLISDSFRAKTERLKYLTQYDDGFKLAEKDLELRGAGSLLGLQQSGTENELKTLAELENQDYEKLKNLVDNLDLKKDLKNLPRLQKYLEKRTQDFWQE